MRRMFADRRLPYIEWTGQGMRIMTVFRSRGLTRVRTDGEFLVRFDVRQRVADKIIALWLTIYHSSEVLHITNIIISGLT